MATYKDDLDIIKAAEKDDKSMTLNAITELDNKGLLGKYGGEGGGEYENVEVTINNPTDSSAEVFFVVYDSSIQKLKADKNLVVPTGITHINVLKPSRLYFSENNIVIDRIEGDIDLAYGDRCDVYGPGTIFLAAGSTPK